MAEGAPERHYSRISLELSHTWPGELYLRFETGPKAAVMVAVTPADLAALRLLTAPEVTA